MSTVQLSSEPWKLRQPSVAWRVSPALTTARETWNCSTVTAGFASRRSTRNSTFLGSAFSKGFCSSAVRGPQELNHARGEALLAGVDRLPRDLLRRGEGHRAHDAEALACARCRSSRRWPRRCPVSMISGRDAPVADDLEPDGPLASRRGPRRPSTSVISGPAPRRPETADRRSSAYAPDHGPDVGHLNRLEARRQDRDHVGGAHGQLDVAQAEHGVAEGDDPVAVDARDRARARQRDVAGRQGHGDGVAGPERGRAPRLARRRDASCCPWLLPPRATTPIPSAANWGAMIAGGPAGTRRPGRRRGSSA